MKNKCLYCTREIPKINKYCNNTCQKAFEREEYIVGWLSGEVSGSIKEGCSTIVRNYLFEMFDNCCQECSWGEVNPITGKVPLEIHHIDGDYQNNREDNLQLLCPNCHSITPNFKGSNKSTRVTRYANVA